MPLSGIYYHIAQGTGLLVTLIVLFSFSPEIYYACFP